MSTKKYLNEQNLQIAMAEYRKVSLGRELFDQYDRSIGYTSQIYDNEHGNGEQVYAVVPEQEYGKDPKEVSEVTVLFRGSTGFGNYKIDWTRILTSGTTPIGLPDQTQSSLSQSEQITNTDVLNDWLKADANTVLLRDIML